MASPGLRAPVLLCGAILLSACGGLTADLTTGSSSTTATDVFEQQRTDGVNTLLERLDHALLHGGPRDLDAILDASAPRAFRDGLVVAQANLSSAVPRPDTGPRKAVALSRLRALHRRGRRRGARPGIGRGQAG